MSEPLVVYVDVDDTLVRSVGSKRIPMVAVVEHVRALEDGGAVLYCWSTGGAAYAESTARELGIGAVLHRDTESTITAVNALITRP